MNNKKLGRIVIALAIILVLGGGSVLLYKAVYIGASAIKEIPLPTQTNNNTDKRAIFENRLDTILSYIDYYYYEDVDDDKLYDAMLHAAVDSLGDPYSAYFSPEEYAEFWESNTGKYSGIGATISQDAKTKVMTIVKPFANSPAYEAGMRPGDILIGVDGENVEGQDLSEVVTRIKGPAGTVVVVTVLRDDKLTDLSITRRTIEVEYVSYKMLDDDIGYILMSEFEEVTANQFSDAVDALEKDGMKGLIIDLRGNPGGLLNIVCDTLDRILPKDTLLVYTIDKRDKKECIYAETSDTLDIPIVLLVDEYSASASEIFTGALKDYGKATVVGKTTFGKGIVQITVPIMTDLSAVKLTESHYYTPNGVCIHGTGIEPDVEVELEEELAAQLIEKRDHDNQLDAAVDVIRQKIK